MLVKDIMITHVKTTTADRSIREVAIQMCFNKISGMPVVDEQNNIVGIVSEKDILQGMYPQVEDFFQSARFDFEDMEAEYNDIINKKVHDVMTPGVFTISPDMPVLRGLAIMFTKKIRRIPVAVDGKLIGIISIGDVHKAIFQKHLDENLKSPAQMKDQHSRTVSASH